MDVQGHLLVEELVVLWAAFADEVRFEMCQRSEHVHGPHLHEAVVRSNRRKCSSSDILGHPGEVLELIQP